MQSRLVVFPSSSLANGHPGQPSERAASGKRPPGSARAGLGAHCGVGPAWVPSPVPAPSTDTRADPASARRAAGAARGRVGRARGPLWCGPSLGALAFPNRATRRKARIGVLARSEPVVTSENTKLVLAPPCAPCSEPSRRQPLEGPPRGQGRRATGRPSPPRSRKRVAVPDQHQATPIHPSSTSSTKKKKALGSRKN